MHANEEGGSVCSATALALQEFTGLLLGLVYLCNQALSPKYKPLCFKIIIIKNIHIHYWWGQVACVDLLVSSYQADFIFCVNTTLKNT